MPVNPAKIIEARTKALQRQIQSVKSLILEPRGVFETVDNMIKTFRYANRETLRSLGISAQAVTVSRYASIKAGERLRRLLERIRR